jgi:hypothetical protein
MPISAAHMDFFYKKTTTFPGGGHDGKEVEKRLGTVKEK